MAMAFCSSAIAEEGKETATFQAWVKSTARRQCCCGARHLPKGGAGASARAREVARDPFQEAELHADLGRAYAGLGEAAMRGRIKQPLDLIAAAVQNQRVRWNLRPIVLPDLRVAVNFAVPNR